jgi:Fe-S oxidoreductase
MISEKSKTIADACRFCWMCRHVCPVGLVTGKEANTPRARGLLISMDSRGIPLSRESAAIMYQCSLCGACANDCVTGYDPLLFTREARRDAVAKDFLPDNVRRALDRALAESITGNTVDERLLEAIADLPGQAENVLYLGDAGFRGSGASSALGLIAVLKKAGVPFTVLRDEPDAGAMLFDLIGMTEELRAVADACIARIREAGAKTIIALDPSYARFFKHECEEMGLMDGLAVTTATSCIDGLLASGALQPNKPSCEMATFHDPCRLARDLDETESARNIMKALGIRLNEMFLNRRQTKCCGGTVLSQTYPDMADDVAKGRWADVKEAEATTLITACPGCFCLMERNAPPGMVVRDLFALVAEACV